MQTARNGQGYISITYSYIDSKFNLNEITLTINYVRYLYTAQHIAKSLEDIFVKQNLHEKVFTITIDNRANMKKAILDMNAIKWQKCNTHTLQFIIRKGLVLIKILII